MGQNVVWRQLLRTAESQLGARGNEMMSPAAQAAFAECGAFYRDTALPAKFLKLYEVGLLFREPTFCDTTYKFGGLAAPHRYLIISANAKCIDAISQHPEWGLCLWQRGRIFKVIGVHTSAQFSQVTLLEIPEALREEFTTARLSEVEVGFANQAEEQFRAALTSPALPEHQTRLWLDRLELPVGIDDNGNFFESWQYVT